jgi:hypothetical protein
VAIENIAVYKTQNIKGVRLFLNISFSLINLLSGFIAGKT